ncbi:MAG: hypothetical protein P8L70_05060 [Halioglobus sp.]|jgi:hypothetical protein|nr:hypothetical protein [Halioglobus sp.]MDG2326082.1 hypothetical protein [Halioglobus sp.]
MNNSVKVLAVPALLAAAQSQAAVDVTGFTVEGGSLPYGLIAMALIAVGIGFVSLRHNS